MTRRLNEAGGVEQPPLAGARILVTRARHQAGPLVERLEALGATVWLIPTLKIAPPEDPQPLERALNPLDGYDWIVFTSPNAVQAVCALLAAAGREPPELARCRVAAVGVGTELALARYGIRPEVLPAEGGDSRALAAELLTRLRPGERVLLPRSQLAGAFLPRAIRQHGARAEEVVAYRTLPAPGAVAALRKLFAGPPPQLVPVTSPSALDGLLQALRSACGEVGPERLRSCRLVALGPRTARACRARGFDAGEAPRPDLDGLVQGLVLAWQGSRGAPGGEERAGRETRGDA